MERPATPARTGRRVPWWVAGLAAGLLLAAALPPFGWWPLGLAGLAVWWSLLVDQPLRRRALAGWLVGIASFGVGISWFAEFSVPGFVIAALGEAGFWAAGSAAVHPDRRRWWTFPAALGVADALRGRLPFGGIPLAGIDLGQAAGPLAPVARLGGRLLVVVVAAAVGVGLSIAVRAIRDRGAVSTRSWRPAAAALAAAAAVTSIGWLGPAGDAIDTIDVAAVQGGGPRGYRATPENLEATYRRHIAATELVRTPVDLVMWPEDAVDIAGTLTGSAEEETLAGFARQLDATFVVGITEDAGPGLFRNAVIAWSADGERLGRYDKVHRVPFGEYFPFRSVVSRLYDIPSSDAVPGDGAGFIDTAAAPLGFAVSYEGFFTDRGRAAVNAGAQLFLIPTNASSFKGSIVPSQQIAAARLRALETGRWVVQAGPTGYTAVLDEHGRVLDKTTLGRQEVLQRTVELRTGRTLYAVVGDWPFIALWSLVLSSAWLADRRRVDVPAADPSPDEEHAPARAT